MKYINEVRVYVLGFLVEYICGFWGVMFYFDVILNLKEN